MKIITPLLVLTSLTSIHSQARDQAPSVFVNHEFNQESSITSFGTDIIFKDELSHFGGGLFMSLGAASITMRYN